ncbi:MAG: anhydro-N-acetylmuramic acid kinase [Phycisphaeraceae bacterium]|nr:anhydro-N-acetylmuramic acid kinase [Phycisphaeraceae bacterium]
MTDPRYIAGVMTGTSLDGLDAALAFMDGCGLRLRARLVGFHSIPLGPLASSLATLAQGQPAEPIVYMQAARALGCLYADAVAELCREHLPAGEKLHAVAAHGQTIWHAPQQRMSWQLFDPWPLVMKLGVPVVYDLRQADLIAGGQGAPITPLADWLLFRSASLVVNLGGICNLTVLSGKNEGPEAIAAMDVGPCNLLLDGLIRRRVPSAKFDADGMLAARGRVLPEVVRAIEDSEPMRQARGRSMGREDFHDRWLDELSAMDVATEDLLASVCELVARLVAARRRGTGRVLLAGGGARNRTLVRHLDRACGTGVAMLDDVGVPAEAREALEMAVLGALCEDGVPITLPQVTGAISPGVAGTWVGR